MTDIRRPRRRLRLLAGAVLGALTALGAAPAAGATPPPGTASTCPDKHEAMTRDQLHVQVDRYGIRREQADAAFDDIYANGNDWICQKGTPFQPGFNWTTTRRWVVPDEPDGAVRSALPLPSR